jgi:hypothetical protein
MTRLLVSIVSALSRPQPTAKVMPMINQPRTTLLSALLMVAACAPVPPKVDTAAYNQMDGFLKELASRAGANLGSAEDFKIVVTQAYYPIGTLMRTGSTIPIDYTACLPAGAPPKSPTPSLFPSYELSKALAVDFGLDNEAIKQLADFGVTIKDTDTINLAVRAAKIQTLADNDLLQLLARGDCKGAVPASTAWLVRGYVLGQRTFLLKNEKANIVKGKIEKIASFNVSVGSGDASLNITDDAEVGFLQIVSQVAVAATSLAPATVTKPQVLAATGRVYVQRDRVDSTSKAESVVAALQSAAFGVAGSIERIDSSRMPKAAQVRYFNEGDRPGAERALVELQKQFPDAKLVRVGLPAPVGQLEVWLPKAPA